MWKGLSTFLQAPFSHHHLTLKVETAFTRKKHVIQSRLCTRHSLRNTHLLQSTARIWPNPSSFPLFNESRLQSRLNNVQPTAMLFLIVANRKNSNRTMDRLEIALGRLPFSLSTLLAGCLKNLHTCRYYF